MQSYSFRTDTTMSVTDEITQSNSSSSSSSTTDIRLTGRVKWFNNKTGFGFITALEGEHKDSDVFVHHSTIKVAQDQYRYLVQGEYIEFVLSKITDASSKHEFQAADVSGVKGGKLICETRWESRSAGEGISANASANTSDNVSRFKHATTARSSKPTENWTTISNERKPFAPSQSTGNGDAKEWRSEGSAGRGRGGRGRGISAPPS